MILLEEDLPQLGSKFSILLFLQITEKQSKEMNNQYQIDFCSYSIIEYR